MTRSLPPYFDRLSPDQQQALLQVIETEARQKAELEHVRTWQWERLVAPRYGSRRQREIVAVARHPSYWAANLGSDSSHACRSIFSVFRGKAAEYHEFHGEDQRLHPVCWKVTTQMKRSRRAYVSYYCDAHLPGEYRPDLQREAS